MGVNERSGSFSGDYEADISVGATDIKVTQEKGRGQRAEGRGRKPPAIKQGRCAAVKNEVARVTKVAK